MPSTESPASKCAATSYVPSALENRFMKDPNDVTKDAVSLCDALGSWKDTWIKMNLEETPVTSTSDLFSSICPSERANKQVIEPLAGILRDPRVFCGRDIEEFFMSVDWLVFADNASYPFWTPESKRIFFDAGGSYFREALKFFTTKYAERGIEFDQIFVWEAKKWETAEDYWAGTPQEVRAKWEPRLTWYNGIPITVDKNSVHNPVHRIHQLCRAEDFCVFKLDIDTPAVELALVFQLLEDPGHLKEFFFEQHVQNPLIGPYWKLPPNVNETMQDSYELFTRLRRLGVRAHSWV